MTNGLEKAKKLTELEVLRAVVSAVSPYSNYIHDRIHGSWNSNGLRGYPPTVALVLCRLKALAASGYLVRSEYTQGYYGYRWTITPLGLQSLDTGGGEG